MRCKTVLVIEDDDGIRGSLHELLESQNYDVIMACNGEEGLRALRELGKRCVILLDMMMPVMDGWAFLDEYRNDKRLSMNPVVVISAGANMKAAPGTAGFLPKPFDLHALLDTIEKASLKAGALIA